MRQKEWSLEFHELIVKLVMSEKIESRSRIVGGVEALRRQDELLHGVADRVHVHILSMFKKFLFFI